jgi:uncharacterized protein YegP (UPF0339 family)
MEAKFEIYKDSGKEWRFHLKAPNGEIIAVSEGYSSKTNAKKGVDAVRRYAGMAPLFEGDEEIDRPIIREEAPKTSAAKVKPSGEAPAEGPPSGSRGGPTNPGIGNR